VRIARPLVLALLFALLPSQGHAAITAKRVTALFEVPSTVRAIAATKTSIALVGESINLLPQSARSFDDARELESEALLFTDVTTTTQGFLAVGIAESSVVTSTALPSNLINPDSIPAGSSTERTLGSTRLVVTEFTEAGEITKESIFDLDDPLIPASVLVTSDRIVIVGTIASEVGTQGFLASIGRDHGAFALTRYGVSGTSINALANPRTLYGSSDERLAGTNRRGSRDGVIFYLDSGSQLTRVVRSFQASTERSWSAVNTSHLAVGSAIRGENVEVAVTKFNAKGEPSWFFRLPGADPHLRGTTLAFVTKKRIDGISNFAPKSATALFVVLDTKKNGAFRSAVSIPARDIKDLTEGFALIVDRDGRSQLVPLAP